MLVGPLRVSGVQRNRPLSPPAPAGAVHLPLGQGHPLTSSSVIELSLIFGLAVLAALLAASFARWSLAPVGAADEAVRVLAAVKRAGTAFAWRQGKRAMAVAISLGGAFCLSGTLLHDSSHRPTAWSLLGGVVVGALLCQFAGQLAIAVAPRASSRVATAMVRATQTHGVSVALRASAAIGIGAEALALLSVGGLLSMLVFGSLATFREHAPLVSCGLALGAVTSALWSQVTGAAVQGAGNVGRREHHFPEIQERFELNAKNPTLILDLVGNHVGVSSTRVQDAFSSSVLLYVGALSVASWVWEANTSAFPNALAFISFPFLIRAFGLLATGVAVFSTRADESDDPTFVLRRGQVAMAIVALAAMGGLAVWQLGQAWLTWFVVAALGLSASLALSFTRHQLAHRRSAGHQQLKEASRLSGPLLISGGVSGALSAAWPAVLATALSLGLGATLGANTEMPGGAAFAAAIVISGFAMALPYVTAQALFDPIVEGACCLAALDGKRRPEVRTRAVRLSQAALSAGSAGSGQLLAISPLLGALYVVALPRSSGEAASLMVTPSVALFLATALFGVFAVLSFGGVALVHGQKVARHLALELSRQMQSFALGANGKSELPADFRPRYADHLEFVCSSALGGLALAPLGVVLLAPVLVLLAPMTAEFSVPMLLGLLTSLLVFATVTSFGLGLAGQGTWSLLSAARRHGRAQGTYQLSTLNFADELGEFAGNAVSPIMGLVGKALVAACLASALILI